MKFVLITASFLILKNIRCETVTSEDLKNDINDLRQYLKEEVIKINDNFLILYNEAPPCVVSHEQDFNQSLITHLIEMTNQLDDFRKTAIEENKKPEDCSTASGEQRNLFWDQQVSLQYFRTCSVGRVKDVTNDIFTRWSDEQYFEMIATNLDLERIKCKDDQVCLSGVSGAVKNQKNAVSGILKHFQKDFLVDRKDDLEDELLACVNNAVRIFVRNGKKLMEFVKTCADNLETQN